MATTGVSAEIVNGQIVNAGFEKETSKALENTSAKESTKSSGMDKNAFMKILVAQMKYQDPMEPTSNTEYIAQYAQFSQVESLDNMAKTLELQRASQLVGQNVTVDNSAVAGEGATITGKVDSVTYSGSNIYLNIGGNSYNADKLLSVDDVEYVEAKNIIDGLQKKIEKLPYIDQLTINDAANVDEIYNTYLGLSDYQAKFMPVNMDTVIENYKAALDDVISLYNAQNRPEGNPGMINVDNEGNPIAPVEEIGASTGSATDSATGASTASTGSASSSATDSAPADEEIPDEVIETLLTEQVETDA